MKRTTGRLQAKINLGTSLAFRTVVSDGLSSSNGYSIFDDGNDERVSSPNLAHAAEVEVIGIFE